MRGPATSSSSRPTSWATSRTGSRSPRRSSSGPASRPRALDLAVEPLDPAARARARGSSRISVPMHTALRLGLAGRRADPRREPGRAALLPRPVRAAPRRRCSSRAGAAAVLGGECEEALVALAARRGAGRGPRPLRAARRRRGAPRAARLPGAEPRRAAAARALRAPRGRRRRAAARRLRRGDARLQAPLPPLPDPARSTAVASSPCPSRRCSRTWRSQVAAGAEHVTFGDPDFLNGPGHALRVARARSTRASRRSRSTSPPRSRTWSRTPDARRRARGRLGAVFVTSAVESLSRPRAREARQGAHPRRRAPGLRRLRRGAGVAAPAVAAAVHALGHARGPPRPPRRARGGGDARAPRPGAALDPAARPARLAPRAAIPTSPSRGSTRRPLTWRWRHPDPRMDALQRADRRRGRGRRPGAARRRSRRSGGSARSSSPRPGCRTVTSACSRPTSGACPGSPSPGSVERNLWLRKPVGFPVREPRQTKGRRGRSSRWR